MRHRWSPAVTRADRRAAAAAGNSCGCVGRCSSRSRTGSPCDRAAAGRADRCRTRSRHRRASAAYANGVGGRAPRCRSSRRPGCRRSPRWRDRRTRRPVGYRHGPTQTRSPGPGPWRPRRRPREPSSGGTAAWCLFPSREPCFGTCQGIKAAPVPGPEAAGSSCAPAAPQGFAGTSPKTSVIPALLKRRNSKTPWFRRTIEVVYDPRLFAARRFSSARQCPSPTRPSQAASPPPHRAPARRRTPGTDDGGLEHPL